MRTLTGGAKHAPPPFLFRTDFCAAGSSRVQSTSASAGLLLLLDRSRQHALITITFDSQGNRLADALQADMIPHLGGAMDLDPIDGDHDVAALQTRALGRRTRFDLGDDGAFGSTNAHRFRNLGREVLQGDANSAAADFTIFDDLVHDGARHVDRDREPDADIAAAWRQDSGVDPDQPAAQIDERAARVAWVDRGVGLDEVLIALNAQSTAPKRADNARSDCLTKAERVADRHDIVSDLQAVAVTERHGLKA